MKISKYDKLNLVAGSLLDFLDQKGDTWVGMFIAKVGDDKFKFNNFANGQTQIIEVKNLQKIKLIRL
jgi:hypothetical protein